MISIIIPSRNERFLKPTILDLLKKAGGNIEVIAVLDGDYEDALKDLKTIDGGRLKILFHEKSIGMRGCINLGVKAAAGDYIMKTDAHCMFDDCYDIKLLSEIKDNWVMIPTRKRLDAENWCIQDVGKPDIDAMMLSFPDDPNDFGGKGLNGKIWTQRAVSRKDVLLDEEMSFQGSCWFMKKSYFRELELMDEDSYGHFWNEAQEIGMKCWLSGGKVMRNKKTWYAHLHKGKKYGRGYFLSKSSLQQGAVYTKKWLRFKEAWYKQIYPLQDLIRRFWPIPGWTEEGFEKLFGEKF